MLGSHGPNFARQGRQDVVFVVLCETV
jgi:hypothetical protein